MSAGTDILPSPELLSFQLFDWLKIGGDEERETLLAMGDMAQRIAIGAFLLHNRQSDIDEYRSMPVQTFV